MARSRAQSVLDTMHPYKPIGAHFRTLLMLLRKEIRHNQAGSRWLTASLDLLSHSSACLLIVHVTPLHNLRSNPEKALYKSRFHLIVNRYQELLQQV
jgi:hypothetical protein